ncbi:MFS transporter [Pseudactinotalea sp. Z1739]|uniref:MFS transporter n=1 Tax=Pseudactinotalea sp. Z1739 TaxID=3413028 RepID=UPI003C7B62C9
MSITDGRPGKERRLAGRRRVALATLTGANLLVFASVTIMNVALPDVRADLGLSASATQGIVTLYSLTFGTLILLAGRLADVVGLRRCLTAGLTGFAAASLAGGLADDAAVLLTMRALQGAAGAFVAATAVSLMSVTFPRGRSRQIAFGTLGVVMGIGTAGSFLLGGALVDLLSWRWCLLVNVPLALVLAAGVTSTAPPGPRPERARRVDVVGAALITASLGALVLGLDRTAAWAWTYPGTVGLLVAGALGVATFAATLRSKQHPLVPLWLLRDRSRAIAYASAAVGGLGMFAGMFILTAFLQEAKELSPVWIGLAFVPFGIGAVTATSTLPALRSRVSPARVLALGLTLTAVAIVTFVALRPESGYLTGVVPAMLLLGSGGTVVMITAGDVATAGAGGDSGVAGAMVNSAQQVGAALGTALLTAVMTAATREQLTSGSQPLDAVVAGYARAGLVGTAILAAAMVGVVLLGRTADEAWRVDPTQQATRRPVD